MQIRQINDKTKENILQCDRFSNKHICAKVGVVHLLASCISLSLTTCICGGDTVVGVLISFQKKQQVEMYISPSNYQGVGRGGTKSAVTPLHFVLTLICFENSLMHIKIYNISVTHAYNYFFFTFNFTRY